jgi:formate-dependent nitrite reductase membrane component NrfD
MKKHEKMALFLVGIATLVLTIVLYLSPTPTQAPVGSQAHELYVNLVCLGLFLVVLSLTYLYFALFIINEDEDI